MRCRSLLALVALFVAVSAARAYVEVPHSLGQCIKESTTIVLVEVTKIEKTKNLRLAPGDYVMEGGRLVQRTAKKPLQDDWRLLYETVLQLAPKKAVEFGCGGGDHLANLKALSPGLELVGMDRSKGQLKYLRKRHPDMPATVLHHHISDPLPEAAKGADRSFSSMPARRSGLSDP